MMILPERRSIMCGRAARQALATPMRLVSMVSFQAFGLAVRNGPMGPWTPAAVIRISIAPQASRMRSTACATSSTLRTSARSRIAMPSACSISSLARSISAWLRASSPILAPSAAKPSASRLPIPRPAPVIRTLFPFTLCKGSVLHANTEGARGHVPGAFHLDEDAVSAGLRESVGKGHLGGDAALLHRHAMYGVRIFRLGQSERRHGHRSAGVHVREHAAVGSGERGVSEHAHI